LVPISGEPNVTIMEAKALACNIVPGRLPRGPAFEVWIKRYLPQDGPANLHPEQPPPRASEGGRRGAPDRNPGKSGRSSANAGTHGGRNDNAPFRQGRPAKGGSRRPPQHDGERQRPRDGDSKPRGGHRPYKGRRDR